jgi:hypothetical protein
LNKRYRTQWIGQFAVATELTRRNYLVSMTLGNAPATDLLCQSPNGKSFSVQVKALTSKGWFPFQKKILEKNMENSYFVFVYIPTNIRKPLEFFVLSHKQFFEAWHKDKRELEEREKRRGRPYKEWTEGISYKTLRSLDFQDRWDVLPQ